MRLQLSHLLRLGVGGWACLVAFLSFLSLPFLSLPFTSSSSSSMTISSRCSLRAPSSQARRPARRPSPRPRSRRAARAPRACGELDCAAPRVALAALARCSTQPSVRTFLACGAQHLALLGLLLAWRAAPPRAGTARPVALSKRIWSSTPSLKSVGTRQPCSSRRAARGTRSAVRIACSQFSRASAARAACARNARREVRLRLGGGARGHRELGRERRRRIGRERRRRRRRRPRRRRRAQARLGCAARRARRPTPTRRGPPALPALAGAASAAAASAPRGGGGGRRVGRRSRRARSAPSFVRSLSC